MIKRNSSGGFSVVTIIIALAVVVGIGAGGWLVWQNRKEKQNNQMPESQTTELESENQNATSISPEDPTEGGKYLVIKEWDVRVVLPSNMKGDVSYSLSEAEAGPDGNVIQAANILLAEDSLSEDNFCSLEDGTTPPAINAGIQYVRSEATKPFDAERYRGTFKENILANGTHNYHVNYITPHCIGEQNEPAIAELQTTLANLEKY